MYLTFFLFRLKDCASEATSLIDSWFHLLSNDQAVYVEAIEQLMVNSDLSAVSIEALRESVDKLSVMTECSKIHAMTLVQNKFLSLYSTQNATPLSATDILFCTIICESHKQSQSLESVYEENSSNANVFGHQIMLTGTDFIPKCQPHAVYVCRIAEDINVIYLLETGNLGVAANLYEAFLQLHIIQTVQIQRDVETLRPVFENLDSAIKKLCEYLKKYKGNFVDGSYKQLLKKWDFIRKKYMEFIKSSSEEALLRAETSVISFLDSLKEILSLTCFNKTLLQNNHRFVQEVAVTVGEKLECFKEFLKVKVIRNFSLGSYPFELHATSV